MKNIIASIVYNVGAISEKTLEDLRYTFKLNNDCILTEGTKNGCLFINYFGIMSDIEIYNVEVEMMAYALSKGVSYRLVILDHDYKMKEAK